MLQQTVVQIMATTKGEFAEEIKTLQNASDEWDKRKKLDLVQQQVKADQAALEISKASVENAAKEHDIRLNALQAKLVEREKAVAEREKKAAQLELELGNKRDQMLIEQREAKQNTDILNADLSAKLKEVETVRAQLDEREQVLVKREAQIKAALAMVSPA